jgi:putative transposase
VVFIPKRRKKAIFGALRRHLGEVFRELARHKEAEVVLRKVPKNIC